MMTVSINLPNFVEFSSHTHTHTHTHCLVMSRRRVRSSPRLAKRKRLSNVLSVDQKKSSQDNAAKRFKIGSRSKKRGVSDDLKERPLKRRRERIVVPMRRNRGIKRTLSQPSYPERKRQLIDESEVNYNEDVLLKEETSKDEIVSREGTIVTGLEIVPYRNDSVLSPCKSIVPYVSSFEPVLSFDSAYKMNQVQNILPFKPFSSRESLVVAPIPVPPTSSNTVVHNDVLKKEEDIHDNDLHSESSMDVDYSMDID